MKVEPKLKQRSAHRNSRLSAGHAFGQIARGLRYRKVVSFMALSNRPENLRTNLQ